VIHETQTMVEQRHPNLLPLLCCFVHGKQLWMVMPYMAGGSLLSIMQSNFPEARARPQPCYSLHPKTYVCHRARGGLVRPASAGLLRYWGTVAVMHGGPLLGPNPALGVPKRPRGAVTHDGPVLAPNPTLAFGPAAGPGGGAGGDGRAGRAESAGVHALARPHPPRRQGAPRPGPARARAAPRAGGAGVSAGSGARGGTARTRGARGSIAALTPFGGALHERVCPQAGACGLRAAAGWAGCLACGRASVPVRDVVHAASRTSQQCARVPAFPRTSALPRGVPEGAPRARRPPTCWCTRTGASC